MREDRNENTEREKARYGGKREIGIKRKEEKVQKRYRDRR